MTYVKQDWALGLAGGTPLNEARLDHIEDGIEQAHIIAESKAAAAHAHVSADVTDATDANVVNTIVKRDATGSIAVTAVAGLSEATGATQAVRKSQLDAAVVGLAASSTVAALDTRLTAAETAITGKAATSHTHTSTAITDSTEVGRSVLTAADATAARTAIGAGTSSLAPSTLEGLVLYTGTWSARPSGFARVRWSSAGSSAATQPAGMITGDVWEHNA